MNGRRMPWRTRRTPYRILVSEMMLQQTGAERVSRKYPEFLRAFPSLRALAAAEVRQVLGAWKGLGYNRRALYLKRAAEIIVAQHGGRVPRSREALAALPGFGIPTASAVCAFAFNQPVAFVETNIRRVFLHFYFPGETRVPDSRILPLVEKALDQRRPREWYYALMDYGAALKGSADNPNRRSAHYRKQAAFEGSARQLRGMVLAALLETPGMTEAALAAKIDTRNGRLREVLRTLVSEGFLTRKGARYSIR